MCRPNLDTSHCSLEKLVIIRTMIKQANIITICPLVWWETYGGLLVSVLDSRHSAKLPSFKHWPGHCVLFCKLLDSALLYLGVKDEFKCENIHDEVLGKPDRWSKGVLFLALNHYVETVRLL